VIDGWLIADRAVPRRQQHTARRIWQRLVAEHGAQLAEVTAMLSSQTRGHGMHQLTVCSP
jgi:hypothetical protein